MDVPHDGHRLYRIVLFHYGATARPRIRHCPDQSGQECCATDTAGWFSGVAAVERFYERLYADDVCTSARTTFGMECDLEPVPRDGSATSTRVGVHPGIPFDLVADAVYA